MSISQVQFTAVVSESQLCYRCAPSFILGRLRTPIALILLTTGVVQVTTLGRNGLCKLDVCIYYTTEKTEVLTVTQPAVRVRITKLV